MLCLVTGGAGFIGSHTVDFLLTQGHDVRVLDSLQMRVHPHGKPRWVPSDVDFIQGDVADPDVLSQALVGVQRVFHLAAYQDYMLDFSTFIRTNTESTARMFELIVSDRRKFPVEKIVFASSQSVSGEGRYACARCAGRPIPSIADQLAAVDRGDFVAPQAAIRIDRPRPIEQLTMGEWEVCCPVCRGSMAPVLINEETVGPGTTYAISKYAIELLADRLGRRFCIPTVCMRYTYVQGPRNSFYNAYSGIARRCAVRLLNGLPPLVYEDGQQLRDFVNVSDIARANVLVMEDSHADFGVFNAGGGRAVTVLEFAQMMADAFGSGIAPLVPGEFRVGDTRHTVSDNSRLYALGWRPAKAVEDNVREYVAWMRDQQGTAQYLEEAERLMREQAVVQRVGAVCS